MIVSLLFACVELIFPFGRDQGNYAYPAWAWLEGAFPYRDVYVFKPPATVWIHALAQALFGHSMIGIRVFDVGWTVATALVIAAIVRRWSPSSIAAPVAGILYSFLYTNFDFWNTCQTDGWFNLPCAGAILLVTRVWTGESTGLSTLLAAGLLLGLAMLFKYTAVTMALPMGALLLAAAVRDRAPRALLLRATLISFGVCLAFATTAVWLWTNGAMPAFLDSQLSLVPAYVAKTGKTTGILDKLQLLFTRFTEIEALRFVLAFVCVGTVSAVARSRGDRARWLPVLWLVGGLASMMAQDKYFRYHFLSMLPGAAILSALAFAELTTLRRAWGLGIGAVVVAVLIGLSPYPGRWEMGARVVVGDASLDNYWKKSSFNINKMSVTEVTACARRIAELTQPGDRVFVWGFDPLINFLAERKTVSRFLYNYPFAVAWGDPRYEAELMAALEADPPAAFVIASDDATPHATGNDADSRMLYENFAALKSFVEARFGPGEVVRRYTIHMRNP